MKWHKLCTIGKSLTIWGLPIYMAHLDKCKTCNFKINRTHVRGKWNRIKKTFKKLKHKQWEKQ